MTSRKKKKSIWQSTFYRVYFALVALALVVIVAGYFWLRGALADYESAQPVYVAEDVAKLFVNGDFDAIYAADTSAAQISEGDRAFYVDSMKALTADRDVAWSEAFSASEDAKNYAVTVDGERFATFTLVPSGETTGRGNRLWTLGSVTTNVALAQPEPEPEEPTPTPEPEAPAQTYQCRVTAPEGYAVSVDGVTLGEENAMVTRKALFEEGFLPEGVANPATVEYIFDSDKEHPEIIVTDGEGGLAEVSASPDRALTWTCAMKEDEATREQYGGAAISLGRRVAKFMAGDASKRGIQKICADNSPADDIFDNLSNRYNTPHTAVSFRDEAVSEFYVLSEDCFTCHVTFDFVLDTKNGEMVYPTAYTFCVIKRGGKGQLYNLLIY